MKQIFKHSNVLEKKNFIQMKMIEKSKIQNISVFSQKHIAL